MRRRPRVHTRSECFGGLRLDDDLDGDLDDETASDDPDDGLELA